MSKEAAPTTIFFHKEPALNLISAAVKEGTITLLPQIPSTQDYQLGEHRNWINDLNQRHALEMFIFADKILLPPSLLDLSWSGDPFWERPDISFAQNQTPEMAWTSNPLRIVKSTKAAKDFIPIILENLYARGFRNMDGLLFTQLLDYMESIGSITQQYEETRQKFNNNGEYVFPLGEKAAKEAKAVWLSAKGQELPPLINEAMDEILSESRFVHEAMLLAEQGIPSYNILPRSLPGKRGILPNSPDKDFPTVLELYFGDAFRSPSPDSLTAALEMKKLKNIIDWRDQINSWSRRIVEGTMNPQDIKREIKDANDYIAGAEFASRLIPNWTMAFTVPLSIASQLVPEFQPFGWIGVGIEAIQLYGHLVEKSVKSPHRLNYRWLMISNKK